MRKWKWFALLLVLLAGGSAQAESLQPRLDEIRWRLAGYVKAGILNNADVAIIEDKIVNDEKSEMTIEKGVKVANWCTPKSGVCAFEYRPKGKTYVTPKQIRVVVFDSDGLTKRRVFMIGTKKCFNFLAWLPPAEKKETPAPSPILGKITLRKEVVCTEDKCSNETHRRPNGFSFQLYDVSSREELVGDPLKTGETGLVEWHNLPLGKYVIRELENQLPEGFSALTDKVGATLTEAHSSAAATFQNRFTPPKPPELLKPAAKVVRALRVLKATDCSEAGCTDASHRRLGNWPFQLYRLESRVGPREPIGPPRQTDANGVIVWQGLEPAVYLVRELTENLPTGFMAVTMQTVVGLNEASPAVVDIPFENKFTPPKPPAPPDEPIVRIIPLPKSPRLPTAPTKEIRGHDVGGVIVYPKTDVKVRKRVINRPPGSPPPGPVPPDLGQPPGDPPSGQPPSGNRPPGT